MTKPIHRELRVHSSGINNEIESSFAIDSYGKSQSIEPQMNEMRRSSQVDEQKTLTTKS